MLLRYIALFLNILVASAIKWTPGWDPGGQPNSGDIVWLTETKLKIRTDQRYRLPFVIIQVVSNAGDQYHVHVAEMVFTRDEAKDGLPAKDFFEGAKLGTPKTLSSDLKYYYVLPHAIHEVTGGPTDMVHYGERLPLMSKEALGRLVMASEMVDGWNFHPNAEPLFGAVYWILPQYLGMTGVKAGAYIPCVVLNEFRDEYRVVRMSNKVPAGNIPLPRGHSLHLPFFIKGPDMKYLENYDVYPQEHYYVKGDRKIMKKWGTGDYIMQLHPEEAEWLVKIVND